MSDKKKRNLIIILCVLAVAIAITAIAFAPFGTKATGDSDSPNITESIEPTPSAAESSTTTTPETTTNAVADTTQADSTIVIPPSTNPIVNPNKNYTLFIDKTTFDVSENDDGVTTLTAKEDGNVKMIITPVRDMSYKQCCRAAEKKHDRLSSSALLEIENANTVYRSQTGETDTDIITTVYCIDDSKGGCIVIECRTPVSATGYMQTIEIMLSMFKII